MDAPVNDADFWLRVGDGAGRCIAATLRLLRYGNADQQAWQQLRGGLLFVADAIGKRFSHANGAQASTTPVIPVDTPILR
jgi:hypothetical protein